MYTAWYTTSCEKYLNNIIEPIIDLSKTDSEYAWIEILANGYKNNRWNRSYAYDQKGQTLQGEKSVQKQMYLINEIFGLTA